MASENMKSHQIGRRSFYLPLNISESYCIFFHTSSSSTYSRLKSLQTKKKTKKHQQKRKKKDKVVKKNAFISKWSCNTCKAEFESLQDRRSQFKSGYHRFNIKIKHFWQRYRKGGRFLMN